MGQGAATPEATGDEGGTEQASGSWYRCSEHSCAEVRQHEVPRDVIQAVTRCRADGPDDRALRDVDSASTSADSGWSRQTWSEAGSPRSLEPPDPEEERWRQTEREKADFLRQVQQSLGHHRRGGGSDWETQSAPTGRRSQRRCERPDWETQSGHGGRSGRALGHGQLPDNSGSCPTPHRQTLPGFEPLSLVALVSLCLVASP